MFTKSSTRKLFLALFIWTSVSSPRLSTKLDFWRLGNGSKLNSSCSKKDILLDELDESDPSGISSKKSTSLLSSGPVNDSSDDGRYSSKNLLLEASEVVRRGVLPSSSSECRSP
ncbi:hypothetical protein OGAPHI_004426 [Ogataea philodendri]|uniref:Secreted protein n=1 Tax=Ogataea philodendri TaxID=1378263 RepID=A0A9P8P7H7_9ASCO|nr:uncharacterized protein OGAPHI_004426 [Ogataea philodendri]KAH3666237.1 hypothetical protein OGAPHI_004426 [Ogataea philodendri]